MIIYALTFMLDRNQEDSFLQWLRSEAIPSLGIPSASKIRITKVIAVPGDPEFAYQALSVTLHIDFPSPAPAREWSEKAVPQLLETYSSKFGSEALSFASVLKTLPV